MNKRLLLLLFIFLILFPLYVKADEYYINSNTTYKVVIDDSADLLSYEEEEKLADKMKELTEYGNIIFKSISYNPTATSNYASNYYHTNFGTTSGTLFLIDMDNRMIYIFSDGNNYNTITSYNAEIITDNIYTLATKEQYYQCAYRAYTQIYSLLIGEKIAQPMKYICNLIFSLSISSLLVYFFIARNSKINETKNSEMLLSAKKAFYMSDVKVTETGFHKVYCSSSSSSGGGGGSSCGGSSGGSSSGGGGGHKF